MLLLGKVDRKLEIVEFDGWRVTHSLYICTDLEFFLSAGIYFRFTEIDSDIRLRASLNFCQENAVGVQEIVVILRISFTIIKHFKLKT